MSQAGITQFPQLPLIKSQILHHHKELPGRLTVLCCCCKCQSKHEVAKERAQGHLCRVLGPRRPSVGDCSFFWTDWICLCHLIVALYSSNLPVCFLLGCEKSHYILHNRTEGATTNELHSPLNMCLIQPLSAAPKHTHTSLLHGVSPLSKLTPLLQPPPPLAFGVCKAPWLCCRRATMFLLHTQEITQKNRRFALQKPAELRAHMVGVQYVSTLLMLASFSCTLVAVCGLTGAVTGRVSGTVEPIKCVSVSTINVF